MFEEMDNLINDFYNECDTTIESLKIKTKIEKLKREAEEILYSADKLDNEFVKAVQLGEIRAYEKTLEEINKLK